jgi:hypothetical protein
MLEQMKLQKEVFGLKRMSLVSSSSSSFFLATLGTSFAAASLAEHRRQNGILVVKAATVWSERATWPPPSPSRRVALSEAIDGDASTGGFTVTSITKEDAERYTIENGSRLS